VWEGGERREGRRVKRKKVSLHFDRKREEEIPTCLVVLLEGREVLTSLSGERGRKG
jgi:hypothetical protein